VKIVHVASSLVSKSAGVREVILGLARAQTAAGLDVGVLGLDHPDWPAERHEWKGINTHVVSVFGPSRLGFSPRMTQALNEMAPDLVHLHGLWMHPGRSVLQWHRASKQPYIVSPHGMLSDVALSYGRKKKALVSWWFQDAVLAHAAAVHATSYVETEEIRKRGIAAPVCVIPNGVADLGFPVDIGESRNTILSLGRIHRKKALDYLVRAWQKLEPDFPDWSVLIVGPDEGGEVMRLQTLIKEIGVKRASIEGPVFGAEKVLLMARAGVFALPTHSENFALTVAESLILGVPVVSSHGAPWSGLETHGCGFWVPVGVEPLADALRRIMSLSAAHRRAMGQSGRAWMLREHSWSTIAAALENCYADALQRQG